MKIQKSKIVMVLIIASVVLFIVFYAIITFGKNEDTTIKNNQVPVPKLGEGQKQYESKIEAIEALKEERKTNVPSVYDERLLDSLGYYNTDQDSIRKKRIVDSVYFLGQKRYENIAALKQLEGNYSEEPKEPIHQVSDISEIDTSLRSDKELQVSAKELGLEHQLFFASEPKENPIADSHNTDDRIFVRVDGTQTVKNDFRLQMRLSKAATIYGRHFPRNTPIYGFVSFKPNRTMISIEHIGNDSARLQAYDLEDGSEGIYIENSFHADARQQIIGDVVDDINVAGVPQVRGIKQLFRRNNRNVKVTVMDGYQLTLKLKL